MSKIITYQKVATNQNFKEIPKGSICIARITIEQETQTCSVTLRTYLTEIVQNKEFKTVCGVEISDIISSKRKTCLEYEVSLKLAKIVTDPVFDPYGNKVKLSYAQQNMF